MSWTTGLRLGRTGPSTIAAARSSRPRAAGTWSPSRLPSAGPAAATTSPRRRSHSGRAPPRRPRPGPRPAAPAPGAGAGRAGPPTAGRPGPRGAKSPPPAPRRPGSAPTAPRPARPAPASGSPASRRPTGSRAAHPLAGAGRGQLGGQGGRRVVAGVVIGQEVPLHARVAGQVVELPEGAGGARLVVVLDVLPAGAAQGRPVADAGGVGLVLPVLGQQPLPPAAVEQRAAVHGV